MNRLQWFGVVILIVVSFGTVALLHYMKGRSEEATYVDLCERSCIRQQIDRLEPRVLFLHEAESVLEFAVWGRINREEQVRMNAKVDEWVAGHPNAVVQHRYDDTCPGLIGPQEQLIKVAVQWKS